MRQQVIAATTAIILGVATTATGAVAQLLHSAPPPAPILNPSVPFVVSPSPEIAISPAMPGNMGGIGGINAVNPFTGLPCSAGGSVGSGSTGTMAGTIPLPETGETSEQIQAPASVFGTPGLC
jgi:hypothetical protein